jgi:hypothetical protein
MYLVRLVDSVPEFLQSMSRCTKSDGVRGGDFSHD